MKSASFVQEVFQRSTRIFSKEQVEAALDKMAAAITAELHDKHPILLCVLVGGIVPMGNLLMRLNFPLEVDYVHVTRYTGNLVGKDNLTWKARPSRDLQDRHVLIVDDILDGGITLASLVEAVKNMGAEKVYTSVVVDKNHQRDKDGLKEADFVGLEVDDHYVFGFGLDYKEYFRNMPGIYMVAPEHEA
ncbi:MAG: hypoxanthine-guanine phosphoribosyltransferase [Legionellales bacterium RIFCSPHIGHO2_12_FULL_37_14]|nr:MAG: hypoxanthine-guanine phosphoribosyltransferase [Legionellales bacterium RIFCSPHIGHO2_12_FULL_37_14]